MTQHAVFIDFLTAAAGRLVQGDAAGAAQFAQEGLAAEPQDRGLLTVLVKAQIALGEHDTASRTLARLAPDQDSTELVQLRVDVCLATDDLQGARSVIARGEAEGQIDGATAASLKAKVAFTLKDWIAARGILVMAIERFPEDASLRAQLAETFIASGGASDARAVLAHIAQPPVNPSEDDITPSANGTHTPPADGSTRETA